MHFQTHPYQQQQPRRRLKSCWKIVPSPCAYATGPVIGHPEIWVYHGFIQKGGALTMFNRLTNKTKF